jgi:hypothetical protein
LKRIRFQFGTLQLTRPRAFVSVQLARNATIGSIREALRAGTYPATAGLVLALVLQRLRCANGLMKRACRQPEDEHAPRATLPKGVRTTPIPGASSILNTRTLWIRDSSFPSQLAFRFEYEPLPSSTAYCLDRAQTISASGPPRVPKRDLLFETSCYFRLLLPLASRLCVRPRNSAHLARYTH